MNREVARELILHLDKGNLNPGNAPKNVAHWLEELGLPMGLLRFLQWDWVTRDCVLAHLRLHSMESIYGDDITKALLPYNLLQIGAAPNGDTLERFNKNCSHFLAGVAGFVHANNLPGFAGTNAGLL